MAQSEFLPYEANYLDLDPTTTDATGMPVIRITYDGYDNEKRLNAYMTDKVTEIMMKAGATQTWAYPFFASPVNTHAYGGTRMGDDPATSVVDGFSLCHDVPNLAVLGGSTFCSTASYNPTQTIQALAWRSAEHIAQNFGTIAR
jgi:gluconate 2-dehydrogenase alpha chain